MRHISDLFQLNGKIALVTGGAGLYGRHIVRALAEAGAQVVVASRNVEACRAYAGELSDAGLAVEGEEYDQASEDSIRGLRDRILEQYGQLDVLFNNSVARAGGDLLEVTAERWEEAMKVNSTGLVLACQILSEPMRRQKSGSIVNIASIYGMVGPDWSIYEGTSITNPIEWGIHLTQVTPTSCVWGSERLGVPVGDDRAIRRRLHSDRLLNQPVEQLAPAT